MKYNKLVVVLAFCVGMQTNIGLCGEKGQLAESKSVWERYVPQFIQNGAKKVNNWKLSTKIAVATLIIGGFAALYNREQILQWVNSILEQQPESVSSDANQKGLMGAGAGNDLGNSSEASALYAQLLEKVEEQTSIGKAYEQAWSDLRALDVLSMDYDRPDVVPFVEKIKKLKSELILRDNERAALLKKFKAAGGTL